MEYSTTTQNANWQFNPPSLHITTFITNVQNCKFSISSYVVILSHKYPLLSLDSVPLQRVRDTLCACVCVSERQRERERMENPRMLSVFLCFGFLGLCHAIESPQYTVVHSESDFEIRLYRQSTWMSAQSKDISFEKATKFGFHRYYYFLLKPCWFWVILGTLFFVWWENEGKQNRNQSKVLGFSLGLFLFFCFVFWGLICSAESDISGWFNRGEISSFWLVAEKL